MTDERRDSFDRDAAGYDLGRPPYPERVYTLMEEIGALFSGARILEIGPGTGQATAELLRRGARVDAVELGSSMASFLRDRLPDDALRIMVGDAHTIPLPDATYDAVVAATSLHWLKSGRLLPRLAQSLKPDGWLVAWWNVFGDPENVTPFRQRVDEIFRTLLPLEWHDPRELPRALRVADRIQELTHGGLFGEARHEVVRWTHRTDATGVRALFSTFPAIRSQDAASRESILNALSDAVAAEGGTVDDPFLTVIYVAKSRTTETGLTAPG